MSIHLISHSYPIYLLQILPKGQIYFHYKKNKTRNFIIYSSVNRGFRFIRWFSPGTLISSANKNDRHDIAKILLKMALNAIKSHRLIQCSIQTGFTVLIYMFITITPCVLLIRIHVHGHNVIIEWNEKWLVTNVLVC